MRKWQAIPVAVVTGLLAGLVLFSSAGPATTYAGVAPTFAVRIDCDTSTPAVVDTAGLACTLPSGPGSRTVNIVFDNNSGASANVAAFNFEVFDPDSAIINPSVAPLRTLPDGGASWACSSPPAVADTGTYTLPAKNSFLGCLDNNGVGVTVPSGLTPIASLTYSVLQDGVVVLVLNNVGVADFNSVTSVSCAAQQSPPIAPGTGQNPVIDDIGACFGATIQVGASNATSTPTNTPTETPTPGPTATPCVSNCPTPTSLAFVTVTPNAGTLTATAPTAVPATAVPAGGAQQPGGGQPSGNTPGGAQGAGGSGPISLPDTGAGSSGGMDWTAATLLLLLAIAIGGAAGVMYFGAAHVSASRRDRRG